MCIDERIIRNKKYVPNKKNNYEGRVCKDERMRYIKVGCGVCPECMKAKGRSWQLRLSREIKENEGASFVTLTFDNENLERMMRWGGGSSENELVAKEVRKFLEEWRGRHKRSPRHWLITEKGAENGRIHLHGIMWLEKKDLKKEWGRGMVWVGEYVGERTIGYITKYITKIDYVNKGFIGKIFTSKGIGSGIIEIAKRMVYDEEGREVELVRWSEGSIRGALPKYVKDRIYTEEGREEIWTKKLDLEEEYVCGYTISKKEDGWEEKADRIRKRVTRKYNEIGVEMERRKKEEVARKRSLRVKRMMKYKNFYKD